MEKAHVRLVWPPRRRCFDEVPSGRDICSACDSSAKGPRPRMRLDLLRTGDRSSGIPTIGTHVGNEARVLVLAEPSVEEQQERPTTTLKTGEVAASRARSPGRSSAGA